MQILMQRKSVSPLVLEKKCVKLEAKVPQLLTPVSSLLQQQRNLRAKNEESCMATQGRQEPQGRIKRQGASLCEKRRDELETAATRRRIKERLILRQNVRHEEEIDIRKNSERPEL